MPCTPLIEETQLCLPGQPQPQRCLVLRHVPGVHPRNPGDYRAFGAALAAWHTAPIGNLLTLHRSPHEMLTTARRLIHACAPDLVPLLDTVAPPGALSWCELALIHGDAAPGNTLVDHGTAVLIDCEGSALAHPGLDLGRALFLTDLTETGSNRGPRLEALIDGYTRHRRPPDHLAQWTFVAGLLIAAWRHAHRDRDDIAPWRDALTHARQWASADGRR